MDPVAVQTLTLRAFFRILKNNAAPELQGYYRYCAGENIDFTQGPYKKYWRQASNEARQLTLGNELDNRKLDEILQAAHVAEENSPWVLIGGPPCQAYSLAGKARNKSKVNYIAEEDHRHFLYKEYLRIVQKYRPSVFIMENVKGILSSNVGGKMIFQSILSDLSDPDFAMTNITGPGYRIHSLVNQTVFRKGMSLNEIDSKDFIVKAENYGIPQARHRVFLLGIREDLLVTPETLQESSSISVRDVICDLPALRSTLSKKPDNRDAWSVMISEHLEDLINLSAHNIDLQQLNNTLRQLAELWKFQHKKEPLISMYDSLLPKKLSQWFSDPQLKTRLNHEARGHMSSDLRRYLYAASYAIAYGHSPKGHKEFELDGLKPNHKNWESGNFSDRFRVQVSDRPSTTITSHISKDGHYYIHPDPLQCRSLTVREAARLQTFPDNYFFQGNRTQQFHQVGNSVPPLLANQISNIVKKLFD